MSKSEFVHLHAHSDYSLLDGCARFSNDKGEPTPNMQRMATLGFKHQALTDHGNLFGAIEFYECCQRVGITPIIGCELYVASGSRFDRKSSSKDEENPQKASINHLTVVARDNEGYQNLIELTTRASLEGFYYKPRVDKELLAQYSKGLTALSGCLKGETAQALLKDNEELALSRIDKLRDIFGKENFYLEIMDHGLESQKKVNTALIAIAGKTGIPLVATNDCHYFTKEDAVAHDAHLCIGTGKKIDDVNRMRYATQEFYYKSPEEMSQLFSLYPEAIKNTLKIAASTDVKISFGELHLPEYQVPAGYSQESYLLELCKAGLAKRFPSGAPAIYQERLEYEMGVIKKLGFPGYFLIVWDFINYARKNNVPVGPGRGSGAGSIISYLLNITSVDPIKFGLLFERFLNPDRRTMPDLDIDFSDAGRDMVITYVREKYGFSNVAQIITFGTMQSRLAVRDVGRVLDIPLPEVDRIAKAIPAGMTIDQALSQNQEFKQLYDTSETGKRIIAIAQRLEGARRHTGVHAAGTVITKEPVTRYTPMYRNSTSGVTTTGYNDESLIKLGLLKVDFLGLRTLTVIAETIRLIESTMGRKIDINDIPFDDKKTYELLARAQAGGVFQLESRGMRDLLVKLKPSKLSDIIALIALFRPGPMQWINDFVARKFDPALIKYGHPLLEPILKETYGITVYQEQVMEISKQLAGFSGGQADKLRKAMGKKVPEELDKLETLFVEGAATKNKIDPKFSRKLYAELKAFGHYAFNKSHSAAYGFIAYQTAYLKANFLIQFMTALASSEIGRTAVGSEDKENKIATYLREARSYGIGILAPSVNRSEPRFSIEENSIRFGLVAIKNVGDNAAEAIANERKARGAFNNIKEFLTRLKSNHLNRKVLESLAKSGALDEILEGDNTVMRRSRFLRDVDFYIHTYWQEAQEMLFDMEFSAKPTADAAMLATSDEIRHGEREMLGIYLSEHPLTELQTMAQRMPLKTISQLAGSGELPPARYGSYGSGRPPGRSVLGLNVNLKKQISKKTGSAWARMQLEDLSGEIDVVLFPRTFAKTKPEVFKQGAVIVVTGRLSSSLKNDSDPNDSQGIKEELIADEVILWEEYLGNRLESLSLAINNIPEATLKRLHESLTKADAGGTKVMLMATGPHGIELPKPIKLSKELWRSLDALLGGNSMMLQEKIKHNGGSY
ncbi:MAG: DNA polymerase III subunit alpha [Elusimicrobiota bacterium]